MFGAGQTVSRSQATNMVVKQAAALKKKGQSLSFNHPRLKVKTSLMCNSG